MVFSSIVFLSAFLPVFLLIFYLCPGLKLKNFVLLAFSLLFYAWGEPFWVLVLLFSVGVDYINGLIIGKHFGKPKAKIALVASLVINLGILAVFKYAGFFVGNINYLLGTSLPEPQFSLPLGISFYTFQSLSYVFDAYKGDVKAQKSYAKVLTYVTMFPQLVAGPIVRYKDIEDALADREITINGIGQGALRFSVGLGKKVLLANGAGSVVRLLLSENFNSLSVFGAWLGIIMFAFQIYFDFSGYSDMAIGLGQMIGFKYKENFNYPYMADSVTSFWRRWHISLSSFFRDYVYIPLGGNRRFQYRNIIAVWLLTGLWHGASWNFVLWGAYYGLFLILEKRFLGKLLQKLPKLLSHAYSLVIMLFGWMLFYFTDINQLVAFLKKIFGIGAPLTDFVSRSAFSANIFLLIALAAASTDYPKRFADWLSGKLKWLNYAYPVISSALIFICFILLLGQTYNPFLYFRF